MKRRMFKMMAAVTMTMAGAVFGTTAMADEQVVLTYAEVNNIDSQDAQVAEYFKERLEELTEGAVTIDIQSGGVLGSENDIVDGMVGGIGTVDMARISCSMLSNYNATLSTLLTLPYVIESRDHYYKVIETELGERIMNEPQELGLGIRGVFMLEEGFRDFFFTENIEGIDDFKNLKIRVNSDPILTGIVENLGANPTVISSSEVYTSLQSGVVDGADQPFTLYETQVFYEVAPTLLRDDHVCSASEVVITDSAIDKLTEEQKEALYVAGEEASQYSKELAEEMEKDCAERLQEKGVNIIDVEDKTPYQEACASIVEKYTADYPDEYEIIKNAK